MSKEDMNVEKKKKTQKAPMAIRPSDYLEAKFKAEAEDKGLSQTKLFERVFWDYLNKSSEEYRNKNLDCSLELQSVNGAATTLIKAIETIITKSQNELARKNNEVLSMKEATDKKIELANLELNNRIVALESENKILKDKLDNSNSVVTGFNTLKEDLENKNVLLKATLDSKDEEIDTLKKEIKERDKAIKALEKEIDNSIKAILNVEKEVALIKEEKNNLEGKLASVQANNQMLQDTLNTFNSMKINEIEAIKNNEATMSQLKISSIETSKNIEIEKLQALVDSLNESLNLKVKENNSLTESYNKIFESKEKELLANFNKERAILEASLSEKEKY